MVERLNTCHPFVLSDVSGTLRNNTRSRAGRADQTAVVLRYARAAELALASRARGSRDPGRSAGPAPRHDAS